ncbi:hypothetical protein [Streptomyces sp. YIM S03343]
MADELGRALSKAREEIESGVEWSIYNSIPDGASRRPELDAPEEYIDFLLIADGVIMGCVVILDRKSAEKSQVWISPGNVDVPEDPDNWFVAGKVNENPVLLNRQNGSVWIYSDILTSWWASQDFERAADSLAEFVMKYGLGPGYLRLTGAPESDQWWRLLRQFGYAP